MLVYLIIVIIGFLPRLPRRLTPWRDVVFAFLLGIALFSPTLAAGIPPGPDVWAKPYLARSAAASIATLTEPGWDIGWMLGFDYTIYGAFSPVMSGLFSLVSGDHFAGVRLEMFTAFVFLPPLAYLVGRRVGRNRWGGFVTLVLLVSARMALGYIGISRFWAVALLPALWLALCGWREGKRGYAPLVTFLLAAAVFIHTQVGAMALLLFGGFSLEMLWRRRKGMFKSWVGMLLGLVALTAIWWQNILEQSPVLYAMPDVDLWEPGTLEHAWQLSLLMLRQLFNPFLAIELLPDIYTHNWFLGFFALILGILGLILWASIRCKRSGVFPALWIGALALLVNLPLFYTIPVLGDFMQKLIHPSFNGETDQNIAIGLQQRYLLLFWLALGVIASKIPYYIQQVRHPAMQRVFVQILLVLLSLTLMECQPFWDNNLRSKSPSDPRQDYAVSQVNRFLQGLHRNEKILYDQPIDYGGIIVSSMNSQPMLQGWIATGYNYNFAFKFLWSLQDSVIGNPQKMVKMLSAIGVRHFIMENKIESYVLVAKMGRVPVSVHGTWLVAEIPVQNTCLNPARLTGVADKSEIDYDQWSETPWKAYYLGETTSIMNSDERPPTMTVREVSWKQTPNQVEIRYQTDISGAIACDLAYQPALQATLDGKPLPIGENLVNGLIWYESPAGAHRLHLYRARSLHAWLALLISTLTLSICAYYFSFQPIRKRWLLKRRC